MSSSPAKPKLIAVVGPTASGKTSLSIELAKKFNGEIVSADSRQIYRGMDIGTAKTKTGVRAKSYELGGPLLSDGIFHYLIDIKNPDEEYTVADFKHDAIAAIDEILIKKKLPFLVGGTGLYVKSVLENLDIPKIKADPALRRDIERDIAAQGLEAIFKKLVSLDPEAAYIVDPKNPRRVIRALEVAISTGKPFTAQRKKQESLYNFLIIGINPPPGILRERIDTRIDEMMKDGLVMEVRKLIENYGKNQIAFDAIGYREIIEYLDGKCSLEDAVAAMKLNTWHFAKRQMTWFKKDKSIHWIQIASEAEKIVTDFLR